MKNIKQMAQVNFRSLTAAIVLGVIVFLSSCSKEDAIAPTSNSVKSNHTAALSRVTANEETMSLTIKMFIEGFYSGNGLMENGSNGGRQVGLLNTDNIKINNPGLWSSDPTDVDFVSVSFFTKTPADKLEQVGETQKGILKTNGKLDLTINVSNIPEGHYFLKVNHRNTIETWSTKEVELAIGNRNVYDFSTDAQKAYGDNMIDVATPLGERTPVFAFFSGDIADASERGTQDGVIESQDYGDMENAVYLISTGYVQADITGDGVVESADYGLLQNNLYFTRTAKIPPNVVNR